MLGPFNPTATKVLPRSALRPYIAIETSVYTGFHFYFQSMSGDFSPRHSSL